jgi:hypothetical protein
MELYINFGKYYIRLLKHMEFADDIRSPKIIIRYNINKIYDNHVIFHVSNIY